MFAFFVALIILGADSSKNCKWGMSMDLPFVGENVDRFVSGFFSIAAAFLVLIFFLTIIALVVIYIIDVTQTKQAIRRNFPVIGRFAGD